MKLNSMTTIRINVYIIEILLLALIVVIKLAPDFALGYLQNVDEIGPSKILSWHPILMVFAFSVCMNEGMFAFYFGDIEEQPRNMSRKKHGILQLISFITMISGYFLMHHYCSITYSLKRFIPFHIHKDYGKNVHVCLGYLTITLTVFQVIIGIRKYILKTTTGRSVQKWHGNLGLLVYVLGQTNILLGFWNCTHIKSPLIKPLAAMLVVFQVITLFIVRDISKQLPERSDTLKQSLIGYSSSNSSSSKIIQIDEGDKEVATDIVSKEIDSNEKENVDNRTSSPTSETVISFQSN